MLKETFSPCFDVRNHLPNVMYLALNHPVYALFLSVISYKETLSVGPHLEWHFKRIETQAYWIVKCIVSALWCIRNHHTTL